MTSSGGHSLEHIITGLGEHYSIMDIYFKPFTACRHTHGAAQASLELVRDEGLDPARIESVSVKTYGIAELAVGKGVDQSSTFVSAQFSIPYVVAVCLLDGKLGPDQLTERRVADADVQALAAKVSVQTDEQLNAVYPEKTSSRGGSGPQRRRSAYAPGGYAFGRPAHPAKGPGTGRQGTRLCRSQGPGPDQ